MLWHLWEYCNRRWKKIDEFPHQEHNNALLAFEDSIREQDQYVFRDHRYVRVYTRNMRTWRGWTILFNRFVRKNYPALARELKL